MEIGTLEQDHEQAEFDVDEAEAVEVPPVWSDSPQSIQDLRSVQKGDSDPAENAERKATEKTAACLTCDG